jgi:hypothetical protein
LLAKNEATDSTPILKRSLSETIEGADCLVVLTVQEQFKRLNLKKLKTVMKSPAVLVDLIGIADPEKVQAEGFIYRGIGRGMDKPEQAWSSSYRNRLLGKNHARNYKELENTNLIAICDVNPERAKPSLTSTGKSVHRQHRHA